MNRHGRAATLAAVALVVCLGAAACNEEDSPIQGEGAPGIDAVALNQQVLQYLAANDMAGATVAVTRAGRLVWSKAYGWADEDDQLRMQPWHRSRIGSTSKFITTIGLLQLLESAAGEGDLGSLATGSNLEALLSTKLYGHPGYHWNHDPSESLLVPGGDPDTPSWPEVTGETALANPEIYWEALLEGVDNYTPGQNDIDVDQLIAWASGIEIRHLLTHTSGHLRSGSTDAATAYFHPDGGELTYSELHQYMLMGLTWADESSDDVQCFLDGELYVDSEDEDYTGQNYQLPPLRYEPGTKRCYSNHGFGVVGMIIDEIAGPGEDNTYRRVIERDILEPLGLVDVVPNNVDTDSGLDAWPHGDSLNPDEPSSLGLSTGGWSATAQDLARIMCGIDRDSNTLRLLDPATVTVMETVPYPAVDADQPLGWDSRSGKRLTKNGSIGGGNSRIAKYLPGYFISAPDDEINVAFMVNDSTTEDTNVPGTGLLDSIAQLVADADIPEEYDLFDPAYRCFIPEPEPEEPGLVAPVPTITEPMPAPPLVAPTDPTPPTPPTVAIRQPTAGQKVAPRGVASILFSGFARDADGDAIPGTYYRWTATQGAAATSLCVGSDFDTGVSPTTIGGLAAVVDCSSFTRTMHNPVPGAGPPITIKLEAQDPAGTSGNATVVISLYTPPTA